METAFRRTTTPRPKPDAWLFYGYSDAPPVICGAGMGAFQWFKSSKEMVKFVEDYFCWVHPAPSSMDAKDIAAEVKRIIRQGREERIGGEELRARLNDFMRNMWQIQWWGTFQELCSGGDDFALELRGAFREDESDAAINADEVKAFAGWLSAYGV